MNRLFFLLSVGLLLAAPASADPATILGVFQNWSAYSSGSNSNLTCYALSQPRATRPRAKRSAIYLMVSDWPGRKVKAEPQIVLGYPMRDNAAASLEVGSAKFPFFARDGSDKGASAWIQSLADNDKLIDEMSKGVSVVAIATSQRGTRTVDTYSLAGFNEALAKIHAVCSM